MRVVALGLLAVYALWLIPSYEYHFLDGVNLLFHEGGHVFLSLLGPVVGVLGGTLGQLFFPIAAGVHLAREGRPFEAAFCVVWLGENFMNIAIYVDDAYTQVLPLVGGGEIHDWNWLLTRWGLLHSCDEIAVALHVLGSVVVVGGVVGGARVLSREHQETRAALEVAQVRRVLR